MSIFTSKFEQTRKRVSVFLYGKQKMGKTTRILDLAEKYGDICVIMSFDEGAEKLYKTPEKFASKVMLAERRDLRTLKEIRRALDEAEKSINGLVLNKGLPSHRVWFVVDTVSHMQTQLLEEARRVEVSSGKISGETDALIREMVTRADFNINLTHMSEVVNRALSFPCNVVFVALAADSRSNEKRCEPSLSGKSLQKIMGDCGVCVFLTHDPDDPNKRVFYTSPTMLWEAGDRSGNLAEVEPSDLAHIRNKYLGIVPTTTTEEKAA